MNENKLRSKLEDIFETDLKSTDSEVKNAILKILKGELLTIRIFLYQELINSKDPSLLLGLETTNKKLKSIKFLVRDNQNLFHILETLNLLLRWLLEICNAEENGNLEDINSKDLRLFGINLTKDSYDVVDFKKSIMSSLWIISYYLSPHWPTEKELIGSKIDSEFSRRLGVEKRVIMKEEGLLPSFLESLSGEYIKDEIEDVLKIQSIICSIDEKSHIKEIKVKSVIKEALQEGIKLGEATEILWQLHKERKIYMLNDEEFIVSNIKKII